MRIALSTSVMQRGRSGVGQYVLALVRALLPAAAAHDFSLLVLKDDLPLFDFAASSMKLVPVAERHRPAPANILWHQALLPGLLRRLGIDVLHVPSYRRMIWRRPCALVSTIHDLAPFRVPGKYDLLRMLYGRVACRRLASRQDRIIAVSRTTANDVESFFRVPGERVTVIPNGLDHHRFRPGSKMLARNAVCIPLGIRGPFFLYVARLEHPAKNHAGLIGAFERFKDATGSDWRLVLAGGDWHGAEVIRAIVRNSRHARDITLLGFVSQSELPDWYRAADVFVFPSFYEGFGLPPVEAMACACPVLSSEAGALADTVSGACGRLDPRDPAQMQSQLTRAASDAGWRGELRLAGLKRCAEFSWNDCASATLSVYLEAAREKRPDSQGQWGPQGHIRAKEVSSNRSDEAPRAGLRHAETMKRRSTREPGEAALPS